MEREKRERKGEIEKKETWQMTRARTDGGNNVSKRPPQRVRAALFYASVTIRLFWRRVDPRLRRRGACSLSYLSSCLPFSQVGFISLFLSHVPSYSLSLFLTAFFLFSLTFLPFSFSLSFSLSFLLTFFLQPK
jgi:hypothetical protein